MAVSKSTSKLKNSDQRVQKFPSAKGKIIAEVELSSQPITTSSKLCFRTRPPSTFNSNPCFQVAPELVNWKSGRIQTHQTLATCSQRLTIFPTSTPNPLKGGFCFCPGKRIIAGLWQAKNNSRPFGSKFTVSLWWEHRHMGATYMGRMVLMEVREVAHNAEFRPTARISRSKNCCFLRSHVYCFWCNKNRGTGIA